jgi:predicted transcriptional regulator
MNAGLTISLSEYPKFLEIYRILSPVQMYITKRIIQRLPPYLIQIDKIIQDLERKMDKESDNLDEDIGDDNQKEGFMNNDKKP